jgi:hypothetical protein
MKCSIKDWEIIKNGTVIRNKRENGCLLRGDGTSGLRKCLGHLRKFYILWLLPASRKGIQNSVISPNLSLTKFCAYKMK